MTKFADQLFDDLMREHGPALARTKVPAAPKRHLATRPVLLAAGVGGVAVAATIGTLAVGGGTPAYAVTAHSNGTVTLAVYQKSGIAGANAKLRQLGDGQVVVVPVKPGCPSINSLPAPAGPRVGHLMIAASLAATKSGSGSVTVNARGIPAGDILVVAFETTANGRVGASAITSSPAPSCVSVPPALASGGRGSVTFATRVGSGAVTRGSGTGPATSSKS
jgi:hypothetical protein